MKKRTIIQFIALFFTALFLYSGISKLLEYPVFREELAMSPVLRPFEGILVWLLPLIELVTAIWLIFPRWRSRGLYTTLVLMISFTCYAVQLSLYDSSLPCSCGGIIEQLSWKGHLIFNVSCIILALSGILLIRSGRSIPVQTI
jgi:uncharacterized membrane protein YphA (DoxX/SURF4 family)